MKFRQVDLSNGHSIMATELRSTDDGFSIDGPEPVVIRWHEVAEIVAYKRDLLTVDLICVGFRLRSHENLIEVDEEMTGYDNLITEMTSQFALPADWPCEVMFPAFATNMTTVWPAST